MIRLVFFTLLLPCFINAQEVLSGKVIDANTRKAVPYATIGLIRQNIGTNANHLGEFSIKSEQPGSDSILISCVGYKTLRLPVSQLRSDTVVFLSTSEMRLPTVIVKNRWINEDLGSYTILKNYYLTSNGYQSQVAKRFTASVSGTRLTSVKVHTNRNGIKSRFRLRVYDLNPVNNGPGNELTDTVIQVNAKGGATSIDLSQHQIWLPSRDFFVAVEWLHIAFNELRYPDSQKSQNGYLLYKPNICFTKETVTGDKDIWYFTYSGFWTPMVHNKHRNGIAISATVSR